MRDVILTAGQINAVLADLNATIARARDAGLSDWKILIVMQAACMCNLVGLDDETQGIIADYAAQVAETIDHERRMN